MYNGSLSPSLSLYFFPSIPVCVCVCRVFPAGRRGPAAELRAAAGGPASLLCAAGHQFEPTGSRFRQRGWFSMLVAHTRDNFSNKINQKNEMEAMMIVQH